MGWVLVHVLTVQDVIEHKRNQTTLYWIEELHHAIVVTTDNIVFNCSYDKDLKLLKYNGFRVIGEDIEPSTDDYMKFWSIVTESIILARNNCILWCLVFIEFSLSFDQDELLRSMKEFQSLVGYEKLTCLETFVSRNKRMISKIEKRIDDNSYIVF